MPERKVTKSTATFYVPSNPEIREVEVIENTLNNNKGNSGSLSNRKDILRESLVINESMKRLY